MLIILYVIKVELNVHSCRDFKFCRAAAIKHIIKEMAAEPPQSRALIHSLRLGAAMIYMLNGLNSRPSEKSPFLSLASACAMWIPEGHGPTDEELQHQEVDEDEMVPIDKNQGFYVVADIVRDRDTEWLRLPRNNRMELMQLLQLYRASAMSQIETTMGHNGALASRRAVNTTRTAVLKHELTPPIQFVNAAAITPLDLKLADCGIVVKRSFTLTGRDVGPEGADDEDDLDFLGAGTDLDAYVDRMWAQFAFDLIQLSPNIKDRTLNSYVTLSPEQRREVTAKLFQQFKLPFVSALYRSVDRKGWSLHFDSLFPPMAKETTAAFQAIAKSRYFLHWQKLRSQLSPEHFARLRGKLEPVFNQLWWLPYTQSDRVWDTRKPAKEDGWTRLRPELSPEDPLWDKAVRIVLNGPTRRAITLSSEEDLGSLMDEIDINDWRQLPPERSLRRRESSVRAPSGVNGLRRERGSVLARNRRGLDIGGSGRAARSSGSVNGRPGSPGSSRANPIQFDRMEEEESSSHAS